MKPKIIKAHMQVAEAYAKLSTAKRLQVGAIVVKDDRIISIGYNGMPAGWDNDCEDKVWDTGAGGWLDPEEFDAKFPYEAWHEGAQRNVRYGLKTKPEVLHAEANAIAKVARSPESAENAVIFITHAPCIECAKLVYQSGIKQVFYRDSYRDESGTNFLKQAGVIVNKLDAE
jgi:dCMP deaminase